MAGNNNIIGGIGHLRINWPGGSFNELKLASEPQYDTRFGTSEPIAGAGVTVADSNSYIEVEVYDSCNIDPNEFKDICDATVTYQEAHGRAQTWIEAFHVGDSAKSGTTFTLRFESKQNAQIAKGC